MIKKFIKGFSIGLAIIICIYFLAILVSQGFMFIHSKFGSNGVILMVVLLVCTAVGIIEAKSK